MTQPQNPNITPLMAQIEGNPLGADLIQIVEVGGQVIYRINNFQAVWYVGSGDPTFIPGQLLSNLYLDNITGHIWQFNGLTWVLLPSGGGGGGSGAIGVAFTTTANIFDTIPLPGVLSSSYAVISATNSIAAAMIAAGQVEIAASTDAVTVTHPPTAGGAFNIVTSASTGGTGLGVTELNGLTGNLNVTAGTAIGVTAGGTSIVVTNQGVTSLNALAGALSLVAGSNVTIVPSGNSLIISSTGGGGGGVTSFNTLTGDIVLAAGSNVSLATAGNTITVSSSAGATSTPWADIQAYGGNPHTFAFNQPTAAATTTASSPNVTMSSSGGLSAALKNGQGICIWKAGSATGQSTPTIPTITSPAVQGAQTITYQIIGYDAMGGLTAASPAGTVTNAPAVFSPLPVTISSITASAGTVTANFSAPLNTTVSAGMTIHIVGVTGSGAGWNGIWTLASAPTNSQVTFPVSGATGTGTVSASSTGRLSNTQPITAISLAANGIMSITTAQTHNYQVGTVNAPTEIIIENCIPAYLNGYYAILTASGSSITVATGLFGSAVAGSVTAGSSTATVWEHIVVACPQLVANTVGYYIYSDSYSPGSALILIGKVPQGDCNFEDYGQCFLAGYVAPGYVPTSPPITPQNQMFTSTILSGGGTTNIVLANNVPTGISALGATLMYDDGPNLTAAMTAASGNTAINGEVILTPPAITANSNFSGYIFNSPITVPQNLNITFACEAIMNETWTFQAFNQVLTTFGSSSTANPSFGTQNFCNVNGVANPFFFLGENTGNTGGITVDGICFSAHANGQIGIIDTCFFTRIANCGFKSALANSAQGNAMGIVYLGSSSLSEAENLNWNLANRFYASGTGVQGQSNLGPSRLPAIWFRGSTNTALPNYNDNTAQFTFRGKHSGNGRGITFDHQYSGGNSNQGPLTVGAAIWIQQGTTPAIALMGDIFYAIDVKNVLNDTSIAPALANLALNTHDVSVNGCSSGNSYSVVSGNPVINLSAAGNTAQLQAQFQRVAAVSFTTGSTIVDVINVQNSSTAVTYSLDAMNQSAQLDISAGLAYILYNFGGLVTVVHSNTPGMVFAIRTTIGNT